VIQPNNNGFSLAEVVKSIAQGLELDTTTTKGITTTQIVSSVTHLPLHDIVSTWNGFGGDLKLDRHVSDILFSNIEKKNKDIFLMWGLISGVS